jgi:hypothetical protein
VVFVCGVPKTSFRMVLQVEKNQSDQDARSTVPKTVVLWLAPCIVYFAVAENDEITVHLSIVALNDRRSTFSPSRFTIVCTTRPASPALIDSCSGLGLVSRAGTPPRFPFLLFVQE